MKWKKTVQWNSRVIVISPQRSSHQGNGESIEEDKKLWRENKWWKAIFQLKKRREPESRSQMGSCHASVHIVLTSAVLGTSKAGCLPGSINQDIPYVWINLAVTQRHHAWKKKKSAADIAGDWNGVLETDEARNLGKDYIWEVLVWPPKYKKSRFLSFNLSRIIKSNKQLTKTKSLWWQEREHIQRKAGG